MNQASEKTETPDVLTLPGWVESLMGMLQFLLLAGGFAVLMVGCIALMHAFNRSTDFLGFALVVPVVMASIAIHEYGHVLGARAMGMTPYLMYIGPLHMWKRRRGWRMRWRSRRAGYAGMVMAFVNPYAPLRRQYLVMLAAGPAMNLVVALIGVLAALCVTHPELSAFLWGFAGFNVAFALVNLVPRHKRMASDGRQIVELCRSFDEGSPEAAFARACGLSVKGVTADKVPDELLDRLAGQPSSPFPLLHAFFVINALQARRQWAQVAELEPLLEESVAGLSPEHASGLELLVGALRCELAFSKAMTGQIPVSALDTELGLDYDWTAPGLRPRLQALMAVRQGDIALAGSLLQQSERYMDHSIDEAFRISEENIRKAIAEEIGKASARALSLGR